MRSWKLALLPCLLALTLPDTAAATTWYVPSAPCPTIQAGLNAAQPGDTVLVAAGEYAELLFWPSRNGIVLAGSGLDQTIVAGNGVDPVIYIPATTTIDSTTVLRDLAIRGGGSAGLVLQGTSPLVVACAAESTLAGPGISASSSAPVIRDCVVRDNGSTGIVFDYCTAGATVTGCTITGNSYTDDGGGGIRCDHSHANISGNTISGNTAGWGGGVCSDFSWSCFIAGNDITDNVTSDTGGAIHVTQSNDVTITGNTILRNEAGVGGGIYIGDEAPLVTENLIADNESREAGGGLFAARSRATIRDNTFVGNAAAIEGGGICLGADSSLVEENWICDNTSQGSGGGVCCYHWELAAALRSNLIGRNRAEEDGGGIYCRDGELPEMTDNWIVENSAAGEGGGLRFESVSPTTPGPDISGNSIVRNTAGVAGGALALYASTQVFLSLNTLSENETAGLGDAVYTESSDLGMDYSNIAYNGWGVHNVTFTDVPAIQSNWWGDASGPYHAGNNPSGLGDSLSTYAWDFTPWLTEADTLAPPLPPRNFTAVPGAAGELDLAWDPVPAADRAGYFVYFDTDTSGFPYADSVDVGDVTAYTLQGLEGGVIHYVTVACTDHLANRSWYAREASAVPPSTGVQVGPAASSVLTLGPIAPNPFHDEAVIAFNLGESGPARLAIHDVRGRRIETLTTGFCEGGSHRLIWRARRDGSAVSPGVYFVRLETREGTRTEKILLLR
jgi:parallel beta-helix repeat protein